MISWDDWFKKTNLPYLHLDARGTGGVVRKNFLPWSIDAIDSDALDKYVADMREAGKAPYSINLILVRPFDSASEEINVAKWDQWKNSWTINTDFNSLVKLNKARAEKGLPVIEKGVLPTLKGEQPVSRVEDVARIVYGKIAASYPEAAGEYRSMLTMDPAAFAEAVKLVFDELAIDHDKYDFAKVAELVAGLLSEGASPPQGEPAKNARPSKPWYTQYLEMILGKLREAKKPKRYTLRGNKLTVDYDATLHPLVLSTWSAYVKRRGMSPVGTDSKAGHLEVEIVDTREFPQIGQTVEAIPSKTLRGVRNRRFTGPVTKIEPDKGLVYVYNTDLERDVPMMVTNLISYRGKSGEVIEPNPVMPSYREVEKFLADGKLALYLEG